MGWISDNMLTVLGISFSLNMFECKAMSIPTSILIDEKGVVVWIDQSDDYRIRSSEERVIKAIEGVL